MLLSIWQVVVLFHTIVNLFVNFLFKRSKKKASPIKQIDTVLSFTWKQIGFSFTFSSLQFAIGLLLCTVLVPVCQARCFHSLRFGNLHLNPKSIVSLRCHGRQKSITCNYRVGLVLMRPLCPSFNWALSLIDATDFADLVSLVCAFSLSNNFLSSPLHGISISNGELITSKE